MHAPYCLNENRVFHEARAILSFVGQFSVLDAGWFEGLSLRGFNAWLQGWVSSVRSCMHKLVVDILMAFDARLSRLPCNTSAQACATHKSAML